MDITGIMLCMYSVYFYVFLQGLESVPVLCSLVISVENILPCLLYSKDPVMESIEDYQGISTTKSYFMSCTQYLLRL